MAKAVAALGPGSRLAKINIKSAYRIIPVHPDDRPLLGMQWEGALYVDAALPFGLHSAPKIFTAIADAIEWAVTQDGVSCVFDYLDDFMIVAEPGLEQCEEHLQTLLAVFERLNEPITPKN